MRDVRKLVRIQILLTILFILFKLIRPSVLNSNSLEFFKSLLLSLPNFFEAIIGILILTGIGLFVNDRLFRKKQIEPKWIYILALVVAGIYVITQELKVHNLGGNNVFDVNDLIYSAIGLAVGYGIILWIRPRIHN